MNLLHMEYSCRVNNVVCKIRKQIEFLKVLNFLCVKIVANGEFFPDLY